MAMRVMHIRYVWVRVPHRRVRMRVGVRFALRVVRAMGVLVMFVMHVGMSMNDCFMNVGVLVMFG